MRKRGAALILAVLLVVVLTILGAATFLRIMNESNLVRRNVEETRALWLAEAGLAEAIDNMPNVEIGNLDGNANYEYSTSAPESISSNHWRIISTGKVTLPSGGDISRKIEAVVRTTPVDNNFNHAIRTTVELKMPPGGGSVEIGCDYTPCPDETELTEEFASINFNDLFGHTKEEMEGYATQVLDNPEVDVPISNGITWVNVSEGNELKIKNNNWVAPTGQPQAGEGIPDDAAILIVNGDVRIEGGTFYGILYVIGRLRLDGNPTIYGTVLAESEAEIKDTFLAGDVTILHDPESVDDALVYLQFIAPVVVSWKEIPI
ncbi:MAG: hypothetical protein AB1481_04480 [Candidatus Omnitrophota bacterium]